MTEPATIADRKWALIQIRRWYEIADNPLYVWEAIAVCLDADEQIALPKWCVDYLRRTAANIYKLYCGRDFRSSVTPLPKISPDRALKLVPNALSFVRQGKRNAFASTSVDREDMSAAIGEIHGFGHADKIERKRSVSPGVPRDGELGGRSAFLTSRAKLPDELLTSREAGGACDSSLVPSFSGKGVAQ